MKLLLLIVATLSNSFSTYLKVEKYTSLYVQKNIDHGQCDDCVLFKYPSYFEHIDENISGKYMKLHIDARQPIKCLKVLQGVSSNSYLVGIESGGVGYPYVVLVFNADHNEIDYGVFVWAGSCRKDYSILPYSMWLVNPESQWEHEDPLFIGE